MKRKKTQNEKILGHLERYGSITPLAALNSYGVMRLAARIYELREKGIGIDSEREVRKGITYTRYRLVDNKTYWSF